MAANPSSGKPRINLEAASILLIESNQQGMDILSQIFAGFGARSPQRASDAEDAKALIQRMEFDLIICAAELGDTDGYDFVAELRRSKQEPNCYAPVIIVTGHTQLSKVKKARDCGANFVVPKPLTPKIILERVIWVAKESRPFIECDTYLGPDRRFHSMGPPPGMEGRRSDDLPLEVGEAQTPNMSQDEIDALLQPQRIAK